MTPPLALVLLWTAVAAAGGATAQTLQVTPLPRDGHVVVSFRLDDAFTDEMTAAIHSGLTITFVYDVDLKRSSWWLDRTIASAVVTSSVRFDNLTHRFHVQRMLDGRIERAETSDREEDVRAWLTGDFDKLPLFGSIRLEPNGEYYVRVRAYTTPRNAAFVWPWGRHDVTADAKFTFVQ